MRVQVKFFAIFRERVGVKAEWTEVPNGTTVEGLWKQYAVRSPGLERVRAAYAVNRRLAAAGQVLAEGDEVGFLPPISGGAQKTLERENTQRALDRETARKTRKPRKRMGRENAGKARKPRNGGRPSPARRAQKGAGEALITQSALDLAAMVRQVEFSGAGAIITFSGIVRDNAHGKSVEHLEYEAYPEMAEATIRDIVAEIKTRWPDVRAAIAHRVGRLEIGEASLVIAVAAPHRPDAYAASRYAIERVKAVLPVWKKEFASDGDHWVEGPIAGDLTPASAEQVVRDAEPE